MGAGHGNPSHDSIAAEQLQDPADQKDAKEILRQARSAIRELIDQKAKTDQYGDTSNLRELATQFPELDPSGSGNRALQVEVVPTRRPGHSPPEGPEAAVDVDPPEPTPQPEPSPDPSPDPQPSPSPRPPRPAPKGRLRLKAPRVIPVQETEVVLAFTPVQETTELIYVSLVPTGSERDKEKPIPILEATQLAPQDGNPQRLTVQDNRIALHAIPNTRFHVRVRTEHDIRTLALSLG